MHPDFPEGTPCWADVALPDIEAGKRFYGDLFGWTFDEGAGADHDYYTAAYSQDRSAAALCPAGPGTPTGWRVHLAVRDAYAAADRVTAAGGRIAAGPLPGGTQATVALAHGPEGAAFGLWQAGTHRGFEHTAGPGTFHHAELHTPDPARSALFHERVFGRALSPAPVRRAAPARLLPHFACADTSATCAEAVRLGGRVRTGPHDSPYGPLAVLRDDQGAVFAVCEPVPGTGDGPGPEPVWESPQQDPERA
ncbi:VOC family protein [Streptomyces sp. NPDC059524]|uniref:VOC family protein n=1 Tax=Streptomyces sp. NPDC059524 TaxID=3346856 RepID=UPI0036BC7AAB